MPLHSIKKKPLYLRKSIEINLFYKNKLVYRPSSFDGQFLLIYFKMLSYYFICPLNKEQTYGHLFI